MVEVGGSNPLAPTSLFVSGCRAVVSISRRLTGFSPPTLRVGVVGFSAKPILRTPFGRVPSLREVIESTRAYQFVYLWLSCRGFDITAIDGILTTDPAGRGCRLLGEADPSDSLWSRSLASRGYRIHSRLPVCLSLVVVPWFRYHGDRRDSHHRPCGSGLSASRRSRSFGLPSVAFPRFARLSNPLAPARMIEKAAAGFSRPRLFCLRHSPGGE